jgi:ABC-2 type transport system permease protein
MRRLALLAGLEALRGYRRPLPWIVLSLTSALMALFFLLLIVRYLNNEPVLRAAGVTAEILMRYFGTAALLMLLVTPLLTMTAFGHGNGQRDGLRELFAAPVTALDIVGGEIMWLLSLAGLIVLVIGLIPLTLLWGAPIDLGVYASNVIGLALFTSLHVALGVLLAALARQPVLAGLGTLLIALALWSADWADRLDPESDILASVSSASRLRGFSLGLVSSADIAYFVVGALACAALAAWRVEGLRRYR